MLVLYLFGETLLRIVQLFTFCITMNDMEHTLNTDKPCFREELVQTPLDSVRVLKITKLCAELLHALDVSK